MGLGDPIDWEPPVLTVVPTPPNPMYVRQGAVLAGTVTDNIGVDRVILREASTGKQLFTATLNGENWEIVMEFTEEQNNEKLAIEIVAFDRVGNSGDQSMAAVTLIVDIGPPVIEDIWIQRTEIKTASLELYSTIDGGGLFDLETRDPRGERSANANRYQNGFFTIAGNVAETETRIDIVSLLIYDVRDADTVLLELEKNPDSTNFSPRWLVSEEALLNAGDAYWPGYKQTYYNSPNPSNDGRYYYRVVVKAYDRSTNESESLIRFEEEGYFCMWQNADIPKGLIDPLVGGISNNIVVTKGATLPVEFYDDDVLAWAYTGLLTKEQWDGDANVGSGLFISGSDDRQKLEWLRNQLRSGTEIKDWRQDRYGSEGAVTKPPILNLIPTNGLDEKVEYVATGGSDADNGQYVLFSLVADRKLSPHTGTGPQDTNKPRERLELWHVDVIDENEPLIVFDTVVTSGPAYVVGVHPGGSTLEPKGDAYKTGNSPEENTFPRLADGQSFILNGYTLRANKKDQTNNKVVNFRMAWIPAALGDSYITQVQEALQAGGYPGTGHNRPNGTIGPTMDSLEALGIQHWDFLPSDVASVPGTDYAAADRGKLLTGSDQRLGDDPLSNDIFVKQVFKKKFDILGGTDDIKDGTGGKKLYKNFTYNGVLENETKLFVIYAEDDMGHVVFRQLRLLGNRTPPNLVVYDLTNRDMIFSQNYTNSTDPQLPNLNNTNNSTAIVNNGYYFFNPQGIIDENSRVDYAKKLLAYQKTGYGVIYTNIYGPPSATPVGEENKAEPNTAYTRDTEIKYWVRAMSPEGGDLAVENIHMRDITFRGTEQRPSESEEDWLTRTQVGHYDKDDKSLSYVELLPEVTQRVFLFTARDTLGNVARVQRTVAVTNAAVLNNITTTEQTGTYGIGKIILLHANFSNLIRWTGTNPPRLNVRYNKADSTQQIIQLTTTTPANTPSLYLEFPLTINEGDTGVLQTMYFDIDDYNQNGCNYTDKGTDGLLNNRPITLTGNARIQDATRGDDAFIPRQTAAFDWTQGGRGPGSSLQGSKEIKIDGIRPAILTFVQNPPTGKTQYTDAYRGYYYKTDDVLKFTLTATKNIFTSGSPIVQFQIDNNWYSSVPWQSSSGDEMIFSVQVPAANTTMPEGTVDGIRINNVSTIVDSVGNAFASGTGNYSSTLMTNSISGNNTVHIDKTGPNAPVTTLSGLTPPNDRIPVSNPIFNYAPTLTIAIADNTGETAPIPTANILTSMDNGVNWTVYQTGGFTLSNGTHAIVTRFTDRAGNIGALRSQTIEVNSAFPNLTAVTAVNPGGWYRGGTTPATVLSFKLDFDYPVRVTNAANVQIVLTNRSSAANTTGVGNNNVILTAAAGQDNINRSGNTTVNFTWTVAANSKEMRDGMYISYINLNGLQDRFVNAGPGGASIAYANSTSAPSPIGGASGPFANPAINNINVEVKVDAIAPTVSGYLPANGGVSTYRAAPDRSNVITLTFREPVMKGSGVITIKPEGNFRIPPVFEDTGYYINCETEARVGSSSGSTIWIPGFYDIYNSGLTAAQRNNLTASTTEASQRAVASAGTIPSNAPDTGTPSMTRLQLDTRTGQPLGPYVKTTHGLKVGNGYSGNYSGNIGDAEVQGPHTVDGYTNNDGSGIYTAMIPDTSVKWVLRYSDTIDSNAAAITNIRNALKAAKFRWQEIEVGWGNVVVSGNTATITLTEPLLQGLQWTLSYPAGTFTDVAGNPAPIQADDGYVFWSQGVRPPVIRVDRKSYDARTANWHAPRTGNNDASSFTYAEPGANSGWGIGDFNSIAYRIETETPGAVITYGVTGRRNSTTTAGTGAFNAVSLPATTNTLTTSNTNGIGGTIWTGAIAVSGTDYTTTNWETPEPGNGNRNSFWVRPNLLRKFGRSGGYEARSAQIVNGDQRRSSGSLAVLHSYNADATPAALSGMTLGSTATGSYTGSFTYDRLEAGKNYVVATATRATQAPSVRGYEGVFRTLVVLNGQRGNRSYNGNAQNNAAGINKILVGGSNVKSGTPSIPGFPLLDGAETGDARFVKMMYNVDYHDNTHTNGTGGKRFYWVSTEIVCEFYMAYFGNGGNTQRTGDVNNYLMVNYGDLSYAYQLDRFPDN